MQAVEAINEIDGSWIWERQQKVLFFVQRIINSWKFATGGQDEDRVIAMSKNTFKDSRALASG